MRKIVNHDHAYKDGKFGCSKVPRWWKLVQKMRRNHWGKPCKPRYSSYREAFGRLLGIPERNLLAIVENYLYVVEESYLQQQLQRSDAAGPVAAH